MRLNSKTASILSKHFSPKSQVFTASISSDTLKHIIGVCGKRSTPAPETVAVRKNNFATPSPFRAWASLNFSLVRSSLAACIFLEFRAVSI